MIENLRKLAKGETQYQQKNHVKVVALREAKDKSQALERGDYSIATTEELQQELARLQVIAHPEGPGLGEQLIHTPVVAAKIGVGVVGGLLIGPLAPL